MFYNLGTFTSQAEWNGYCIHDSILLWSSYGTILVYMNAIGLRAFSTFERRTTTAYVVDDEELYNNLNKNVDFS